MNIELVEFTIDYKLNKFLKLNINPISFQQTKYNIYYYNLYYFFEFFFQFILITKKRKENILNQYKFNQYNPCIEDLFLPLYDSNTYYPFFNSCSKYNKFKNYIYSNEGHI